MTEPQARLSPSGRFLTPPTPAGDLPLSSVFYTDLATTTALADQNGFIGTPFATAVQALAAAIAGDVIYLVPTDGTSYGALTIGKSLCVQSVSNARERFDGVQVNPCATPVGTVAIASATVALVALQINSLDLNDADGNCSLAGCEVNSVSAGSGGNVQANDTQFNVGAFATATFLDCAFAAAMTSSQMNAFRSVFGAIGNGASPNVVVLSECTAGALTCGECTVQAGSSVASINSSGDVTLAGSSVTGAVTVTFDLTATSSVIGGAVTVGGDAFIWATQLGAGLTVTGNLTIDAQSYAYATAHGTVTVTGTLTITGAYSKVQKQLGWNPASAANSNVFTLLPAGHAPGMYLVNSAAILRAAASAATGMNRKITFTGPNGAGAFSVTNSVFGASPSWTGSVPVFETTNTNAYSATNTGFMNLGVAIISDGSQPITLQMLSTGFTGTPSIDLYASVDFVGFLGN